MWQAHFNGGEQRWRTGTVTHDQWVDMLFGRVTRRDLQQQVQEVGEFTGLEMLAEVAQPGMVTMQWDGQRWLVWHPLGPEQQDPRPQAQRCLRDQREFLERQRG